MKIKRPLFFDSLNIISIILIPLTLVTVIINILKKFKLKKKFKIKSICVGNIYIGGTGKTPLTIKINDLLRKKFKSVFIKKKYSDQKDEQNLLRKEGKLICLKQRFKALKIAVQKNYEVAIFDDGLQDKSINYNISIACFNSSEEIGNGLLLPSGPLRESIKELKNYDAVFLNGERKNNKFSRKLKKINKNLKIFHANYVPTNLNKFDLKKNYLLFCGLGNPDEFKRTLNKYKFKIKEKFIFPDHYNLLNKEINNLKKIAIEKKLDIITTEKDYLRLSNSNKKGIKFLKIKLQILENLKFVNFLNKNL